MLYQLIKIHFGCLFKSRMAAPGSVVQGGLVALQQHHSDVLDQTSTFLSVERCHHNSITNYKVLISWVTTSSCAVSFSQEVHADSTFSGVLRPGSIFLRDTERL